MNHDEIWLKENGWIVYNVINKKFGWLMNDEDLVQAGFESLIRYRNQVGNNGNKNGNGGFDKGIAWGKVWNDCGIEVKSRFPKEHYGVKKQQMKRYVKYRIMELQQLGETENEMYNQIYLEVKNKFDSRLTNYDFSVMWKLIYDTMLTYDYISDNFDDEMFEIQIKDPRPTPEEVIECNDTVEYIYKLVDEIENELIKNIYKEYMQYIIEGDKVDKKKIAENNSVSRQYVNTVINRVNKELRVKLEGLL